MINKNNHFNKLTTRPIKTANLIIGLMVFPSDCIDKKHGTFKKDSFFARAGAIAPNAPPQLRHCLLLPQKKLFKKQKGLELVSLPSFLHGFWRKMFLTLSSINWHIFIVWLLLLLEILRNMCIVIIYFPGCEVINFEINFFF